MSNKSSNSSVMKSNNRTSSSSSSSYIHDTVHGYWFPKFIVAQSDVWLVSTLAFAFSLISLCLYLKVCHIIVKHRKTVFTNSFYILVLYLAVPDCLYLIAQLTFGFFVTIIGFQSFSFELMAVAGCFCELTMCCVFFFVAFMGLNRYFALCHYSIYKKCFDALKIHVSCIICIVLGVLSAGVDVYCNCYLFKADFAWKFQCREPMNGEPKIHGDTYCTNFSMNFDYAVIGFLTAFIPLINLLTFFHYLSIRCRSRRDMHGEYRLDKQDVRLFCQVMVISAALVTYFSVYWYNDWHPTGGNARDAVMWFFGITNSSVNPYMYVLFSSDIQSYFSLSRKKKINTSSTPAVAVDGKSIDSKSTGMSQTSSALHH